MYKNILLFIIILQMHFQQASQVPSQLEIKNAEALAQTNLESLQKRAFNRVALGGSFYSPVKSYMIPVEDDLVRGLKGANVVTAGETQEIKGTEYTICKCYGAKLLSSTSSGGTRYYWTGIFYTRIKHGLMKDRYQVEYIETRGSLVTLMTREESYFNTRGKVLGLVCVGGLVALLAYKSKTK